MRDNRIRILAEGGILIAAAFILSQFKVFQMPQGGSITAVSMLPILIFAIRNGFKEGVLAGVVFGILQFILGGSGAIHWLSIVLDYLVAFGVLGLAGIFGRKFIPALGGVVLAVLLRFAAHVLSGVLVYGSYAPEGQNVWVYSILYNSSYILPELIVTVIAFVLIYKPLQYVSLAKK